MEISTARFRYDFSGIGGSEVMTDPPMRTRPLYRCSRLLRVALFARGRECRFEFNPKAFVAANTPSAMMMQASYL